MPHNLLKAEEVVMVFLAGHYLDLLVLSSWLILNRPEFTPSASRFLQTSALQVTELEDGPVQVKERLRSLTLVEAWGDFHPRLVGISRRLEELTGALFLPVATASPGDKGEPEEGKTAWSDGDAEESLLSFVRLLEPELEDLAGAALTGAAEMLAAVRAFLAWYDGRRERVERIARGLTVFTGEGGGAGKEVFRVSRIHLLRPASALVPALTAQRCTLSAEPSIIAALAPRLTEAFVREAARAALAGADNTGLQKGEAEQKQRQIQVVDIGSGLNISGYGLALLASSPPTPADIPVRVLAVDSVQFAPRVLIHVQDGDSGGDKGRTNDKEEGEGEVRGIIELVVSLQEEQEEEQEEEEEEEERKAGAAAASTPVAPLSLPVASAASLLALSQQLGKAVTVSSSCADLPASASVGPIYHLPFLLPPSAPSSSSSSRCLRLLHCCASSLLPSRAVAPGSVDLITCFGVELTPGVLRDISALLRPPPRAGWFVSVYAGSREGREEQLREGLRSCGCRCRILPSGVLPPWLKACLAGGGNGVMATASLDRYYFAVREE